MELNIREANNLDKNKILKFCKNTFSWGDYIEYVWDYWLSEKHLFLAENQSPVGICHAFFSNNQLWIEGIRVDSEFRRQNIASRLVKYAEKVGSTKRLQISYMLIDTENSTSLLMAKSLNYQIFETWKFYSLSPKVNLNQNVSFEKDLDTVLYPRYVKSWRWLPIDAQTLNSFNEKQCIIKSEIDGKNSIAILSDSEHFEKTMIATLFSNSNESTFEILSFLQNMGIEKDYERIQILTKENLPSFDSLEHKLTFHLMKKSLI